MAIALHERDLKRVILLAVQEHGKQAGIADKKGAVGLSSWARLVRADGHKIPDLARWFSSENLHLYVEPLMGLAEVFRFYGLEVDGTLMPADYFVSILINGQYKALTQPPEKSIENIEPSVVWIKKELRRLPQGDRITVLQWFLSLVSRNISL